MVDPSEPQSPQPPQPPTPGPPLLYPKPVPAAPSAGGTRTAIGWVLLAAVFTALVLAYVIPTVNTFTTSLSSATFMDEGEYIGFANYTDVLGDDAFIEGFRASLAVALGLAAGGGVLAFLVAWCVHLAGSGVRLAARITAVLAAVAFAPAGWVVAMRLVEIEAATADAAPPEPTWSAWTALVSGTVFGLGLLAGLAAFRSDRDQRVRTVVTAGGLTALAVVAAGLQSFSYGALTGVTPKSPNVYVYEAGFRLADFGRAAAASTVLLIALAFLGIGAALLFVLARVRIDVPLGVYRTGWLHVDLNQRWYEPRTFRVGPGIGAIVLIALFGVGTLVILGPWLTRAADGPGGSFGGIEAVANTWGSALVTTVVAVASAFVGAYAIGVIRPLGGESLWLLLPFAPWLFVGTGPLALVNFDALTASESYGTFLSTAPRAWIAVPALFLLTALLWGVETGRRAMVDSGLSPEAARGASVRAAWPLTVLIGLGVLLANAQDSYWQTLSMAPERPTSWAVMTQAFAEYFGNADDVGVGIGYPLWLLIPFAGIVAAAAIWSLPKISVHTGR